MPELYLLLLDRILTPVLLLLSVFLLLRGHNLPGGGFIAGLMAAAAFQLQILSRGRAYVQERIGAYLQPAIGAGLTLAASAGLAGFLEHNVFKGIWFEIPLGPLGDLALGTPVIFDLGVFLVVVSVTTSYLLGLNRVAEGEGS